MQQSLSPVTILETAFEIRPSSKGICSAMRRYSNKVIFSMPQANTTWLIDVYLLDSAIALVALLIM